MAPRVLAAAASSLAALAVVAAASCASTSSRVLSHAGHKPVLVVLGEDWSDVRNTHRLTGGAVPPSPPYSPGRFSNGPLWAEVAAAGAGFELSCGAYAGSTTSNAVSRAAVFFGAKVNGPDEPELPDLYGQARAAFAKGSSRKDVLAIFAGANDFVYNPDADPTESARRVVDAVKRIPQFAAGRLPTVLFELPPLDEFPAAAGDWNAPLREKLQDWTRRFNTQLHNEVEALSEIADRSSPVAVFRTTMLFNEAATSFVKDKPCLDENLEQCGSPSTYLFWDATHFTAAFHARLGAFIAEQLKSFAAIAPAVPK